MDYITSLGKIVTHHSELKRESCEEKEKNTVKMRRQNPEKIFLIALHVSQDRPVTIHINLCIFGPSVVR